MNSPKISGRGIARLLGRRLPQFAALAAATVMMTGAADAKDLRYAFGFPTSFATYPSIVRYAEQLKKDAGIDVKVFAELLLKPSEMMGGLRDGLADIGWDAMPYNQTEFSEGALIADLSMLITAGDMPDVPGAAMAGAVLEYVMLNCPDCLAQFKKQNVVFLSGTGTTPYYLICNKPILTLADIKGKRIRTAAGNFERWASAVGAAGVPMPGNETYDALGAGRSGLHLQRPVAADRSAARGRGQEGYRRRPRRQSTAAARSRTGTGTSGRA